MRLLGHHHGHAVLVWLQNPAAMIVCLHWHAGGTVVRERAAVGRMQLAKRARTGPELLELLELLQAWVHQLMAATAWVDTQLRENGRGVRCVRWLMR